MFSYSLIKPTHLKYEIANDTLTMSLGFCMIHTFWSPSLNFLFANIFIASSCDDQAVG